jgi:hypothetical protein
MDSYAPRDMSSNTWVHIRLCPRNKGYDNDSSCKKCHRAE